MSNTAETLPGTGTSETSSPATGSAWSNPSYICDEASNNASNVLSKNEIGSWIRASNFGFNISQFATINGIIVTIRRYVSATGIADNYLYLVNASSTNVGDNKASATVWPTATGTATYGTSTDNWNASPTYSMVNSSNFGIRLAPYNNNVNSNLTAYVCWVKIQIYFTITTQTKTITDSVSSTVFISNMAEPVKSEKITDADGLVKTPKVVKTNLFTSTENFIKSITQKAKTETVNASEYIKKTVLAVRSDIVSVGDILSQRRGKVLSEIVASSGSILKTMLGVKTSSIQSSEAPIKKVSKIQDATITAGDAIKKAVLATKSSSISISEAITSKVSFARTVIESIMNTSSMQIKQILSRAHSETIQLVDSILSSQLHRRILASAVSVADSLKKAGYKTAIDIEELSEKAIHFLAKRIADLVSISEQIRKDMILAVEEAIQSLDTLKRATFAVKNEVESIIEFFEITAKGALTLLESLVMTERFSKKTTQIRQEIFTTTEEMFKAVQKNIMEEVYIVEDMIRAISKTILGILSPLEWIGKTTQYIKSETVNIDSNILKSLSLFRLESFTIMSLPSQYIYKYITHGITNTDSISILKALLRIFSESLSIAEIAASKTSKSFIHSFSLSEMTAKIISANKSQIISVSGALLKRGAKVLSNSISLSEVYNKSISWILQSEAFTVSDMIVRATTRIFDGLLLNSEQVKFGISKSFAEMVIALDAIYRETKRIVFDSESILLGISNSTQKILSSALQSSDAVVKMASGVKKQIVSLSSGISRVVQKKINEGMDASISCGNYQYGTGYMGGGGTTIIASNSLANRGGTINLVKMYFQTAGYNVTVGIFSGSGTSWTFLRSASIGNVPAGSWQEYPVSLSVEEGNAIGIYMGGGYLASINDAFCCFKVGNHMVEEGVQTYTGNIGIVPLYGSGGGVLQYNKETFVKYSSKPIASMIAISDAIRKSYSSLKEESVLLSEFFSSAKAKFMTVVENIVLSEVVQKSINRLLLSGFALGEIRQNLLRKTHLEILSLDELSKMLKLKVFIEAVAIGEEMLKSISRRFDDGIALAEMFWKRAGKMLEEMVSLSEVFSQTRIKTLIESLSLVEFFEKTRVKTLEEIISIAEQIAKSIFFVWSEILMLSESFSIQSKVIRLLLEEIVSVSERINYYFIDVGRSVLSFIKTHTDMEFLSHEYSMAFIRNTAFKFLMTRKTGKFINVKTMKFLGARERTMSFIRIRSMKFLSSENTIKFTTAKKDMKFIKRNTSVKFIGFIRLARRFFGI